ncbi:MAG: CYTH domain-containing protein [Dysgonamonadaceae bacterium]|jgi:adenylate cyclase|nr:CYTH domain-containing protein [Dysgonamonadaceae bacterium]
MPQEIERKFTVSGNFRPFVTQSIRITQGYLSIVPERTVRIRVKGDKGYITVKGTTSNGGIGRFEWEKEIPLSEARELLEICEPGVIEKTRYLVPAGKHSFEVDEFHGKNEGLIIAEIELVSEDEAFEKPSWLGREVTGDARYYNSALKRYGNK